MLFTEDDLRSIVMWAVWRTSRSLGIIDDNEPYAPLDAVAIISASKGHKDALEEFAAAYEEWYKFHLDIFKEGKSGNLSSTETASLIRLIQRRDDAKKALIDITPT